MIGKIKRKIFFVLANGKITKYILKVLILANNIMFHWDERQKMCHYGDEDSDKIFYLIRSRGKTEGLLSSFFYVSESVEWAKERGYIPIVDFSDETCQYYVGKEINGTYNAWEYYFTQPENLNTNEIVRKKNVLKSGWFVYDKYDFRNKSLKNMDKNHLSMNTETNITIQPYILNKAYELKKSIVKENNVLGVFIRGTDYVRLQPAGHPIQPSIDMVCEKIDEVLDNNLIYQIYLVTEDYDYYIRLKEKYGDMVVVADDFFVKDYNGKDYLSNTIERDPYEVGLNYLIRLIILSECDNIICSKASGSFFSNSIRRKKPNYEYWFELGTYKQ